MRQVGREAELQQLSEAWQGAVAGERQFVFVTGEAGLGKTEQSKAESCRTATCVAEPVRT